MKLLTKEEEREHYYATLKGGTLGLTAGLGFGLAGVWLASQRYHFMRQLTLPLKAFLVTSSGTFAGIISADHYSRAYEMERNPIDKEYRERETARAEAERSGKSFTQRAMDFGKKERYKIVAGSWVASMFAAFAIVNRNKFLTGQQKIVQARVYAQFLTLGVLVASAAFEISDKNNEEGRWETVRYIDPNDPEHKRMLEKQVKKETNQAGEKEDRSGNDLWREMMDSEEKRMKEREEHDAKFRKEAEAKHQQKHGNGKGKKPEKKDDGKSEKKDDGKDEKKDAGKKEKKDKKE